MMIVLTGMMTVFSVDSNHNAIATDSNIAVKTLALVTLSSADN